LNFGVGAFVNVNVGNAGTFTIYGEWKLGFRLDKIELEYDPRVGVESDDYNKITRYSSMSSVPRGGVIW